MEPISTFAQGRRLNPAQKSALTKLAILRKSGGGTNPAHFGGGHGRGTFLGDGIVFSTGAGLFRIVGPPVILGLGVEFHASTGAILTCGGSGRDRHLSATVINASTFYKYSVPALWDIDARGDRRKRSLRSAFSTSGISTIRGKPVRGLAERHGPARSASKMFGALGSGS